ncbi:hypothetical protein CHINAEXTREME_05740 [Halobiforma lacisalsi AJ5]|uniref:DUF7260 domain-containing protein n=1 Tax=Natronobacterium lacisalsi AJ5 TaxID=358396 RepID=M0LJL0_NATLA|nr:hypothetical protein [Halobiforma lacisalsi]APW97304.1 hypothetical protein CHINAEXTREME_05740 [Halobiforma lacisalsi AJ5]EMA33817.1 hypothetical protein C445_09014 [Halobiforma lacisalsi AJ5]
MTDAVPALLENATARVTDEREAVSGKLSAVDRFAKGVDALPAVAAMSSSPAPATARVADGGRAVPASSVATVRSGPIADGEAVDADRRADVRDLFAETIRPYSVADVDDAEPLSATIAEELGDDVAVALAPSTDRRFTADLKQVVLSATRQRRAELEAMERALDTEAESLRSSADAVVEICAWLLEADETPLSDLGFEALCRRHDRLAEHRATCRRLLERRQSVLGETAASGATAGLLHRSLVTYLYRDLPSAYPVLSTVVRLLERCRECQRVVRDHLTRRV